MDETNTKKPALPYIAAAILAVIIYGAAAAGAHIWPFASQKSPISSPAADENYTPAPSGSASPSPSAKADPTAGWKAYTNSHYGYSFKHPLNYKFSAMEVTPVAPYLSSSYANIIVKPYTGDITTEDKSKLLTIDGARAYIYTSTNTAGGIEWEIRVPGKLLTVIFDGKNSESKDHLAEYNLILSTFRFLK